MPDEGVDHVPMSTLGALLRRSAALFYDVLLLIAIWFFVTAAALAFTGGEAIVHPLYRLAMLGVGWLFFDWCWRRGGQTLGMRAWRLRLVADDGMLTRTRTFARYALGVALFGVVYLWIPFDAERRALHDKLTRTRVLRVPKGAG